MKKILVLLLSVILTLSCVSAGAVSSKSGTDLDKPVKVPPKPDIAEDLPVIVVWSKTGKNYDIPSSVTVEKEIVIVPSADPPVKPAPENRVQKAFFFRVIHNDAKDAWADAELARLKEAGGARGYFGVDLVPILGEGDYRVYEFAAVAAGNYDRAMGAITADFAFATPLEAGCKVAVLIGFAVKADDGEAGMEWKAVAGNAQEDSSIEFTVDPETILRIQKEGALMAVVGK